MTPFRWIVAAFLAVVWSVPVPAQAQAQERETLGTARLFGNDVIGDRHDRWRSGGYSVNVVRGPAWHGELPQRVGEIMEYRFRAEVIAPDNLNNPSPTDRLYAGSWWVGAHTHFDWAGFDFSAGADLVVTGEQSGIRSIQSWIHSHLSMPRMNLGGHQVDNGIYLNGQIELARDLTVPGGSLRPFVEMQAGVETLARAGFDLTIGSFGEGGLRVRDPVTGQRIAAINGDTGGLSLLFGADTAFVESSVFLPADRGYQVEERRHRLRAGVNYGFGDSNIFYGITYLSEEFVGQDEGQIVGSLSLGLRF